MSNSTHAVQEHDHNSSVSFNEGPVHIMYTALYIHKVTFSDTLNKIIQYNFRYCEDSIC